MTQDQQLREAALDKAWRSSDSSHYATDTAAIILRAEAFYLFLSNKTAPKKR